MTDKQQDYFYDITGTLILGDNKDLPTKTKIPLGTPSPIIIEKESWDESNDKEEIQPLNVTALNFSALPPDFDKSSDPQKKN